MFQPIIPAGSSKPIAPYVHGSKVGDTVYVAGTLAIDPDGKSLYVGDVKAQTKYVIEQVVAVVEAAGGTIDNIVYNAIFLKRREDYAAFNEVYGAYFGKNPPARYCVICGLVREEFLVEIAATAHIPPKT
ncbi:MAG: pyrimidine utilization protein C [Hyphomicrobium sp.]|jgi:aminoacrylate peracid reductase|uniref:Rid family hydrolase n=1 Tax=Hyphomicrobium sp. CS1BSMeth3 TaxID=1892844 RepID=UPI00093107CD|nr:Rid family hydrolase [Hyphomicrobium sp. CS1BSMeth3]MBN9268607.1 pyrimidine utilization protein C [Hyphomicrobium sp.]MBN9280409.1 pyrimidine utilization protein C [Hyphomicrobium sp.]OJU29360.1 MAG: pyrimidine utilization protein C [Alphaproteobacteria bacterium 64-6]